MRKLRSEGLLGCAGIRLLPIRVRALKAEQFYKVIDFVDEFNADAVAHEYNHAGEFPAPPNLTVIFADILRFSGFRGIILHVNDDA